MECLTKIIGITDTDCQCVTDGLTAEEIAEIKESNSGLFLDDLEGGLSLRGIDQIDSCKNFAQMALSARDTAGKKLYADMLVALSLKYKSGKGAFIGNIGKPSYASTLPTSQQYQYLKLAPNEVSDAVLKVTGLRIIVDRDDTLTVSIWEAPEGGNQGVEIFTATVEATASMYATVPLATPLILPLSENGQKIEYYVIWSGANGAKPKDIKLDCNCGFRGNGFSDHIKAEGGEMADPAMLNERTTDKYTHGMTLDVDIRCVPGNLICREYDADNAIAVTMAWATMYKAGELLIESVMASNEVNRYTMMNREYLWGKRNHFKKEYESRIQYLASVIDVSSSDCFICRETKMFMGGILA